MGTGEGERPLEEGIRTDLRGAMSYADYLDLQTLLSAQHPRSRPEHHDELLFIVAHQTSELWLKLVLHELRGARELLAADEVAQARKCLARVKHVLRTLADQWSVLATLTPHDYAQFRGALASASGFQSWQYRAVEFILGNKHAGMLSVFAADPEAQALLSRLLAEPTVYDAFLGLLARAGHPVPEAILERDLTRAWVQQPELIPVLREIYLDAEANWEAYATCEDLVDIEDAFQLWRFRHMRTVQRTIGWRQGTGGSSGVAFLKRALELSFFPELITVRGALD